MIPLLVWALPAGALLGPPGLPTQLGSLGGGISAATAVSDTGWVAGYASAADGTWRAFVRSPGALPRDAGMPAGALACTARAVNDAGTAAGSCAGVDPTGRVRREAVVWDAAGPRALPGLPGAFLDQASGIDAAGQVVGQSRGVDAAGRAFARAVLWTASGVEVLGSLPGGSVSEALAIGRGGHVVGGADMLGAAGLATHAFRWTRAGGMEDLGVLPGGRWSRATAVNAAGDVAGLAEGADGAAHAFLWTSAGGMRDLGLLPGGTRSEARGLSDGGEVVGSAEAGDGTTRGFLWSARWGMRAIPRLSGGSVTNANAINASGVIVGDGDAGLEDLRMRALMWQRRDVPLADAGPDLTVPCAARLTPVELDASASWGFGGTMEFVWSEGGVVLARTTDPRVTVQLSTGLHALQLVANESGISSDPVILIVTILDAVAPVSRASVSPAPNARGWHRAPVQVGVAADDVCSDVAEIRHSVDAGAESATAGPLAQVGVAGDGIHGVRHRAVDLPGNAEAPSTFAVRIDSQPPALSATYSPPPASNGWFSGDTRVTFVATDALSGVAMVSNPVLVTGSGEFAVTGMAEDNAGNRASLTVRVRIDRSGTTPPPPTTEPPPPVKPPPPGTEPPPDSTVEPLPPTDPPPPVKPPPTPPPSGSTDEAPPPVIVLNPSPRYDDGMWPPDHKMSRITIRGAISGGGGVAGGVAHVSATSSEPDDAPGSGDGSTTGDTHGRDGYTRPVTFDVPVAADGTFAFTIFLRAERSALGPGRTYTVTVTATDATGVTTTKVQTFFVPHSKGTQRKPAR